MPKVWEPNLDFLVGKTVREIRYGPSIRIVFEAGERVEPTLYADLGWYTLSSADGSVIEQAESKPADLGATLGLVGARVAEASVLEAALELTFEDRRKLRYEPSLAYEAWQVVGGEPGLIWSTTDGEVDGA